VRVCANVGRMLYRRGLVVYGQSLVKVKVSLTALIRDWAENQKPTFYFLHVYINIFSKYP
jgi:hypothetical protein